MNWQAGKAAIMLFVALGEVCQLHDKLHLIHCAVVDEGGIEGCVLLPWSNWPQDKICENSRVIEFLTRHADVLKQECLAEYLENMACRDTWLVVLLAARQYGRARDYAENIIRSMKADTCNEFDKWLKSSFFYKRPEIRISLKFDPGPRSCLAVQSRLDSRLDFLDPLEFTPTSSRIESMDEAREVILMHLSQMRPFAIRYMGQKGVSFLRGQEEKIAAKLPGGKQ